MGTGDLQFGVRTLQEVHMGQLRSFNLLGVEGRIRVFRSGAEVRQAFV